MTQEKSGYSPSWILVGLIVLAVVGYLTYRAQDSARSSGSPEETQAMEAEAADGLVEDPWLSSPELVNRGQVVYEKYCAVCHGKEGKGNGPASSGLVPPPRNLVEGKWKQGGSSKDLFVTMEMGVPGTSMIGFAHLPKIQRWALVHYLRSITMNKVEDDLDELERFGQTAE